MTRAAWLALGAAAVAALTNAPILGHYFLADDFANLVEVANFGPREFIPAPASGHLCIVRNSALYLTFLAFGMRAEAYFAIVLATHVLNVLLLFAVARRLTGSAYLACFGALLFAISPTNGGTLGWYSVYGHALATTFVLTALSLLVCEDERAPVGMLEATGVAVCALAASQSFGTGAAAALVLPVVALLLRPALLRNPIATGVVWSVPALVAFAAWAMNRSPSRLNPNAAMSNALMIAFATYWSHMVPVFLHVASIGIVSLLLGTTYALATYPDLVSGLTIGAFAAAVGTAIGLGSWSERRRVIAILLLPLASYAAIAAGRGTLVSALRPNDFVRVFIAAPRYHYLAHAGLALLTCTILAVAWRRWPGQSRPGGAVLAGWLLCLLVSRVVWPPPRDDFRLWRTRTNAALAEIENEIRKQPPGSAACIPNRPLALCLGFPGSFGVYILHHRDDELEGRRVYFTTSDPRLLALRLPGSRAEALLAPVGACPPPG